MKKIISWFLGCLLLATMTTCNNEKYLPIYALEGKLYFDCKRTQVVANAKNPLFSKSAVLKR